VFPFDPALEGKRLYLMRHGKTYEPRLDTPMVSPEDDPTLRLTPDGRRGVEATAAALAGLGFDAAFSSAFRRSLDTARIVARPHGLEVSARRELEELRLYPGPGGDMRAVARLYVELVKELKHRSAHEIELDCGTSLGAVLEQAERALRECLEGPQRRILVVAHGGVNRLLLTRLMGIPLERFLLLDQDFACVNVIEFVRGGRPWVRALNLTVDDPFKGGEIRA
jgi:broad specificity phosphatase PhoE